MSSSVSDSQFQILSNTAFSVKAVSYSCLALVIIFTLLLLSPSSKAEESDQLEHHFDITFNEWVAYFELMATSEGISQQVFDQVFDKLKPNEMVLNLDKNQPEFTRSIWKYIDQVVSKKRVKKGREILLKYQNLFNKIEEKYHVPGEIIIAIWGMESDFGGNYGNMNVVRSLATLAYDGKRKEFSQQELLAALNIMQDEKLQANEMIGSWAGAIGHPQFMPSSFLKYAVDFDEDGKHDLWNSLQDVFASIANYMHQSGWKKNESWGVEVNLPKDFDWQKNALDNPQNIPQPVSKWVALGIKPASQKEFGNDEQLASLFFPAGHQGPTFLVYDNFEVIKKYNLSLSYALGVGLLASNIKSDVSLQSKWPREDKPLSLDDKVHLQNSLIKQGYDVGKVDGKIGSITREAIRQWQLKNMLAADGYMTLPLLKKLQNGAFAE